MALIVFRSPACGSFFMFADNFKTICDVIGKKYATKGILTPQELPSAIEKLQKAMENSREQEAALDRESYPEHGYLSAEQEDELRKKAARVPLATRAFPLLDMMQRAQKKGKEVVWGVDF